LAQPYAVIMVSLLDPKLYLRGGVFPLKSGKMQLR
jgi:hypothetical protein